MSPGVRTSNRACGETAKDAFDLIATKSLFGIDLFHTCRPHHKQAVERSSGRIPVLLKRTKLLSCTKYEGASICFTARMEGHGDWLIRTYALL